MIQQAVILAGGRGTRLMPLTDKIPKPMVTVAGKPFLYWQLLYLKNQKITKCLILVSYLSEKIIKYFHENPIAGLQIDFSVEAQPLGTGGAIKNAFEKLDDIFFVINGDSFAPIQFLSFEMEYQKSPKDFCVLLLAAQSQKQVPGNIKLQGDLVIDYKKEAGSERGFDWTDAGVYIFNKKAIGKWPSGKYNVEERWPESIQHQSLSACISKVVFYDIGTVERLKIFEGKIHDYF